MKNPISKPILGLVICFVITSQAAYAQKEELRLEILNGHSGGDVLAVAASHDGKFALTGSTDQTALLWDLETGKQLRRFSGVHENAVSCVQFSRDDRFVLTAGWDSTIQLWETATGRRVHGFGENRGGVLIKHSGRILSCAISADMKMVATAGEDRTARIWDFETGKQLLELGHAGRVNSIAFSPDSRFLLTGGEDKIARFYSTQTGKEEKQFVGHTGEITSVSYSSDGKQTLTGSSDKTIRLWNFERTNEIKRFEKEDCVSTTIFTNNGNEVIAGCDSAKNLQFWNIASGRETLKLNYKANSISILPNTENILIAGDNFWPKSTVAVINVTSKLIKGALFGRSDVVNVLDVTSKYPLIVTAGDHNTSALWNIKEGRIIKIFSNNGEPKFRGNLITMFENSKSVAFSPNGELLARGSSGYVDLYSTTTFELLGDFLGTRGAEVESIEFSPDGKFILLSAGSAVLTDLNGREKSGFYLEGGKSYALAFSPNGLWFAVSNEDNQIRVWNAKTGEVRQVIKGFLTPVWSIGFSPDGKTLATASGGEIDMTKAGIGNAAKANGIQFFDVETGKEIEGFGGEFKSSSNKFAGFKSVAYSPDGKFIAAGSFDGKVYLRNNETKELEKFEGHTDTVNSVKFAKDANGKLLVVSGSSDSTTRIWDAATGEEICALVTFHDGNWAVVQTRTGRYDAPNGGEIDGIQWVFGNEVIELKQLSAMYYTPNLLPRLLGYNKDELTPVIPLRDVKLYPEIVEQRFDERVGKLNIKLRARNGGIGETLVLVNDKLAINDARDERLRQNPGVLTGEIVSLSVDLSGSHFIKGKENKITVITSNYLQEIKKGNIQSRGTEIVHLDQGEVEFTLPSLYAIVGGVSDYEGEQLDLRFAAKDAEDFSNALSLGAKRLFCPKENPSCLDKVQITTLSTSGAAGTVQPTKENFRQAFAEIARKAKPEDIVVIYLAGHGVSFGTGTDTYFYLTKEARSASKEDLTKVYQTAAISSAELTEWLTTHEWSAGNKGIKALKQVLILDTCAAGEAASKLALTQKRDLSGDQIRAIEFLKDKTGTFVLMGSTADAPSYEASQYGQGLLTYSLLQAMQGADLKTGGYIDVRQLFSHAEQAVPKMAINIGGVQKPIVSAPLGTTFTIGQMTDADKEKIKLPQPKPLMLRPLLTNPETGDDDLKLIPALRKMLDAESSYTVARQRGTGEPKMIYIDDDSFPNAIRLTGTYTIEGDEVKVKAFLRRDGKTIAQLAEITAQKPEVVNKLLAAIQVELAKIN